ncbi:MAG TPA: hypothetical protein VFK48_02610 [Usitatibacter sp.]|nr:hypothetical protein [Usitatibacter sp.]
MTEPAFDEITCRHCGQVEREYHGIIGLARSWATGYCRICGTYFGEDKPTPLSRPYEAASYGSYYFLMAFVWGVIFLVPTLVLLGPLLELDGRRIALTLALAAGAVFGIARAERQRRRGEIIHRYAQRREAQGGSGAAQRE